MSESSPRSSYLARVTLLSGSGGSGPVRPSVPSSSSLFSNRDGRVSENTVCLIRKLLVLDPQQRLAASEVLESLSSIIASW